MKKMKFDPTPDSLGKVLTPEEMKAISMASDSQGNCKCTLHMTDGTTQTASTYSYYDEACKDYCDKVCADFVFSPQCYKADHSWSEMGSGSEPGSGSGSTGSGSGGNGEGQPLCLCNKNCKIRKDCTHRTKAYECETCYCQKLCDYYKKLHPSK